MNLLFLVLVGLLAGVAAALMGVGGGFLIVPLLLAFGYASQKAVGTSFLAILAISLSAVAAHHRLAHIDYRAGAVIGIAGIAGAQIGAWLSQHVPTPHFRKVFAILLVALAWYLFFKK